MPSTANRNAPSDHIAEEILVRVLQKSPAWATSAFVHMVILFILFSIPFQISRKKDSNEFTFGVTTEIGLDMSGFDGDEYFTEPLDALDPLQQDFTTWDENLTETEEDMEEILALTSGAPTIVSSDPFGQRSEAGRMEAVRRGGGTPGSEEAVEHGLTWLQRHQSSNGAWSPADYHRRCDANAGCGKGSLNLHWMDPACTGLGLMCFLGAGYTGEGRAYRITVNRAVKYLLEIQRKDSRHGGAYFKSSTGQMMYNHTIGTLAMSEAYAMTRRSDIRRSAQRGIDYLVKEQNPDGGWRHYGGHNGSDTSVTGWAVMALKSARLAGLSVPEEAFTHAKRWFAEITNAETGLVYYIINERSPDGTIAVGLATDVPAMTAVGMLCRQFMGESNGTANMRNGAKILMENKPQFGDPNIYYYYYAMLTLYQYGGKEWDTWNPLVRDPLVRTQEMKGCARGSWQPSFYWANHSGAGRVYSTAMAILTLEVYYRYLPIYQVDVEPDDIDRALIAYKEALEAYRDFVTATKATPPDPEAVTQTAAAAEKQVLAFLEADSKIKDVTPEQQARRDNRIAATHLRLASVYIQSERPSLATELLDDFEERFPDYSARDAAKKLRVQAYAAGQDVMTERGNDEHAERFAKALLETRYHDITRNPDQSFETYLWVANKLFESEEYWRAAELYQTILDRFANDARHAETLQKLKPHLAKCHMEAMNWSKALVLLREIEIEHPRSAPIKNDIATCLTQLRQYDEALEVYLALREGYAAGTEGWWDAMIHIVDTLFAREDFEQVYRIISRTQSARPSLGGPELKERFLALKKACSQAVKDEDKPAD